LINYSGQSREGNKNALYAAPGDFVNISKDTVNSERILVLHNQYEKEVKK
jgi:hypothetical protein